MKAFFKRLGEWLMERLEEKSTYCGLAVMMGIWGRHIPTEVMEAIQWWGPFIAAGLIAASTKSQP